MIFYLCHQYACWNIKHQYREPLAISPSSAYNFCDVCFAQLDTYCNQIKIGKRCFTNGKYIICYSIEITKWIIIYVVFLAKRIYKKKNICWQISLDFHYLVERYFRRNNFMFKSTISFWIFEDKKIYTTRQRFILLEQTWQSLLTRSSGTNSNTCVSIIKSSLTRI